MKSLEGLQLLCGLISDYVTEPPKSPKTTRERFLGFLQKTGIFRKKRV